MYVGRLAPSPTGFVHLGIARSSLVAWLDARHAGGRLLMRVEDIDGPRTVDGAAARILEDLTWLGIDWDGPPVFQSDRDDRYHAALERLRDLGRTFFCTCSRKEVLAASAPHGEGGPIYPGTCRDGAKERPGRTPAIRLRTEVGDHVAHTDRLFGRIEENVDTAVGDFVLRRADGLWAYQLAVTVDDLEQGVTTIVRGADLLSSMPRQLLIRRLLDPDAPALDSLHVPLVRAADGRRLAKRDGAASIRALNETPEALVGNLGYSLGLIDRDEPMAAIELLAIYDPAKLSKDDTILADGAT